MPPALIIGLMKRFLCALAALVIGPVILGAAEAPTEAAASASKLNTAAAAAVTVRPMDRTPDFLEHLVDSVLQAFDVRTSGNTVTHYVICVVLLLVALLARRIVTALLFPLLRRLAAKTETTLDDKLFPALEGPVAAFVMTVGMFAALRVLKLSPESDSYIGHGSQVAFSLVIFWGLWRALATLLDHATEVTLKKGSGLVAFMPWIKKALLTVFVVVGVLLTIQGFGYDVKAILAGLGIGGLAFALAAQDTLANIFGAIVVAVDQPFRVGESVRIGANAGAVEDIGLRSTRIRLVDKSLMTIPNKTVAAETITNLSRFTRRRFEQVLGFTYDTTPAEMQAILGDIRAIVVAQPEVDAKGVLAFFRDFSASSLDIWLVYEVLDPDLPRALAVKQRVNLAIMQAVEARGLSFAFPTQTLHLAKEKG
ncbi:MAG: mechanosensitive ion channel family protein [Opitutaceae bacterium]|nr:mechanosensitive ion channel family protein [Opitutaceae bacterium]